MKKPFSSDTPQLISIKEASQMLNIHPNTLRRWDNLGLLKAVRLGARKDRSYQLNEILKYTSSNNIQGGDLDFLTKHEEEQNNQQTSGTDPVKRFDQVLLVSAALNKLYTVPEIINFTTNHMANLLKADQATFFAISDNGEQLEIVASFVDDELTKANKIVPLKKDLPTVEALQYDQVIIIESQNELLERFPDASDVKRLTAYEAYVALPLVTPSQKFGVIGISFKNPQRFTKIDISFMHYLAQKYALALERAYFYEKEKNEKKQLERSKDLLQQINQSALEFLNPMNLEETYAAIISEVRSITGADYGSVFILENNRVERKYASDKSLHKLIARKRGDTFKTMQSRRTKIYAVVPENDPHPLLNRMGIKAALRIPICHKNKSFGVINLLFKKDINYTEPELEIFQLFGSLAALAIRNAQMNDSKLEEPLP